MITKDRPTPGGGVALYLKNHLNIVQPKITVPYDLECTWTLIKGNFAFNIKMLAVCAIYYPPRAPYHDELLDHLVTSVDVLKAQYDDLRIILMGDVNRLNIEDLCLDLGLRNLVTEPTHEGSILDVILTDAQPYTTASTTITPPIGLSRHHCVLSRPVPPAPPTYVTRVIRPFRDSYVRHFGQWVTEQDWHTILTEDDPNDAVMRFEGMIRTRYEEYFPAKRVKVRANNKPWLTPHIRRLMALRRRAWNRGNIPQWRALYRRTRRDIKDAKRNLARNIERFDVNSSRFANSVKNVMGLKRPPLNSSHLRT